MVVAAWLYARLYYKIGDQSGRSSFPDRIIACSCRLVAVKSEIQRLFRLLSSF